MIAANPVRVVTLVKNMTEVVEGVTVDRRYEIYGKGPAFDALFTHALVASYDFI
jgi:hypothetical protein